MWYLLQVATKLSKHDYFYLWRTPRLYNGGRITTTFAQNSSHFQFNCTLVGRTNNQSQQASFKITRPLKTKNKRSISTGLVLISIKMFTNPSERSAIYNSGYCFVQHSPIVSWQLCIFYLRLKLTLQKKLENGPMDSRSSTKVCEFERSGYCIVLAL